MMLEDDCSMEGLFALRERKMRNHPVIVDCARSMIEKTVVIIL